MKSVLYLVRRPPGPLADETTDLMLVSGVFEQATAVVFVDDGVLQLAGLDARQSSLRALPTYEVESLYADAASLAERDINLDAVTLTVAAIDPSALQELIASHDIVLTD